MCSLIFSKSFFSLCFFVFPFFDVNKIRKANKTKRKDIFNTSKYVKFIDLIERKEVYNVFATSFPRFLYQEEPTHFLKPARTLLRRINEIALAVSQ